MPVNFPPTLLRPSRSVKYRTAGGPEWWVVSPTPSRAATVLASSWNALRRREVRMVFPPTLPRPSRSVKYRTAGVRSGGLFPPQPPSRAATEASSWNALRREGGADGFPPNPPETQSFGQVPSDRGPERWVVSPNPLPCGNGFSVQLECVLRREGGADGFPTLPRPSRSVKYRAAGVRSGGLFSPQPPPVRQRF